MFVAAGVTALLLIGVGPVGVKSVADYHRLPGSPAAVVGLILTVAILFVLAAITLLTGKVWTGLFGVLLPPLFIARAIRLARPGSPAGPLALPGTGGRLARANSREERLRLPVIRAKIRVQRLLHRPGWHQPCRVLEHQAPPPGRFGDQPQPGRRVPTRCLMTCSMTCPEANS